MLSEPLNPFLYQSASFLKRIVLLPRSMRLKCVKLSGSAAGDDGSLNIFYAGEGESLGYLKRAYFSKVSSEETAAIAVWALKSTVRKHLSGDTIVIVEINRLFGSLAPAGGLETFAWIKHKVFPASEGFKARRTKIEKSYGNKIRRQKYTHAFSNDPAETERFYHELYLPYVTYRYKENAHPRRLREFQDALRSGFLLKVFDGNEWVAGLVCARYGKTIYVFAGGVAPDFEYHLKRGAHSACEYFIFKWAEKNSIRIVDMLRTRPNLLDGSYQFKRKWAAMAFKDSWPHTTLRIYIPGGARVPEILNNQLIWRKSRFEALGAILGSK